MELREDLTSTCMVGDVVTVVGLVKVLATGDDLGRSGGDRAVGEEGRGELGMRLTSYQTRPDQTVLYNTLPILALCMTQIQQGNGGSHWGLQHRQMTKVCHLCTTPELLQGFTDLQVRP